MIRMKISRLIPVIIIFLISAINSLAACEIDGKEVPCEVFWEQFGWIFTIFLPIIFLFFALGMAFWIWMLVDCCKREFNDKTMWILVIVLTGLVGGVIYFFVVKKKSS